MMTIKHKWGLYLAQEDDFLFSRAAFQNGRGKLFYVDSYSFIFFFIVNFDMFCTISYHYYVDIV